MHSADFDDLLRLPVVQYYEESFHKATGVVLRIVPPDDPGRRLNEGLPENDFCTMVGCTTNGCEACRETHQKVLRAAAGKLSPQEVRCFAGLTDIAVPVIVGQRHIATLLSGQVLSREPTERDFGMIVGMLAGKPDREWEKKTRTAYFQTPVLTTERMEAIIHLLKVFALFLADYAARFAQASAVNEPKAVMAAKQYAQAHVAEAFTLDEVSAKVGVSRFYFCKLFKKATGLTYTDYVTQLRVEKAKVLLVDDSLRITEVAFAAGFGSIPRFNSVMKHHLGKSPMEYRSAMRAQSVQT